MVGDHGEASMEVEGEKQASESKKSTETGDDAGGTALLLTQLILAL